MDLTRISAKTVKRLSEKKIRQEENAFKVEGTKCVFDTLGHFPIRGLFATAQWLSDHPEVFTLVPDKDFISTIPRREMSRLSSMSSPPEVIAVYEKLPQKRPSIKDGLIVALDSIQDPGNLGTIIRTCDWFGIKNVICSKETVDLHNPKVIQATMGALTRVNMYECDLIEFISDAQTEVPVYGTFLDGQNIYDTDLGTREEGIIVFGNEGNGISPELAKIITKKLLIPSYPPNSITSESLNVGAAAAIVISLFRSPRRCLKI